MENIINFDDLDAFTKGYIAAALWAEIDGDGTAFDDNYSVEDIDQKSMRQIVVDCLKFQAENKAMLDRAYTEYPQNAEASPEEMAGHDFWLTRRGHGCGFWDGDLSEPTGWALTEAAKSYGDVVVETDGDKVYFDLG